jgi:hypothetical protein
LDWKSRPQSLRRGVAQRLDNAAKGKQDRRETLIQAQIAGSGSMGRAPGTKRAGRFRPALRVDVWNPFVKSPLV